jgi:hypothetical protein
MNSSAVYQKRPTHDCNQTPCCLARLTPDELRDLRFWAHAAGRDAAASNDADGIDYFGAWLDKFEGELARRRQDGGQ